MTDSILSVLTHEDGELVVDSRLVAYELGIQHESFMRTIRKYQPAIEAHPDFGHLRFEIGTVTNSAGAVNDVIYALLTESQANVLMTFSRNTDRVIKCKLSLVAAFEKAKKLLQSGFTPSVPIWHQRLIAFHQARPVLSDRFCTFEMTNHYVAAPLEGAGYVMHDNMMPDLSIGLGYRYFLQRLGYDLDDPNVRIHYDLEIPCYNDPGEWQVVSPWQYNNDLLPTFVKYINDYWKPNRMLSYFAERDDSALQAVSHVLGLPYQESLFQLEGFG